MHKLKAENIFSIILLIILAVFVIMSFSYNSRAQAFPFYFGLFSFVMVLLQLVARVMKNPPKFLNFVNKKGALGNPEGGESKEASLPWKQVFVMFIWLAAYVTLMSFIHYLLATLIFLIAFLHFAGKVKLKSNLLFSGLFTASLYVLFVFVLQSH